MKSRQKEPRHHDVYNDLQLVTQTDISTNRLLDEQAFRQLETPVLFVTVSGS
ncbi:hypothetical protein Bpfe_029676, partial [Biomphalaria pfeifferi]